MSEGDKSFFTVAVTGLAVNLGLSALKVAAGMIGHSRAVVADGIHSLSDVATDFGTIFCARYCTKPADHEHPYGHGRLEVLIALGIALFMAVSGVGILISSINDLQSEPGPPPGLVALGAAIGSLVCKEILFHWTKYHSVKLKSPALRANAWHHRSDAFSSIPIIVAVFLARFFPAWHFLDSIGGMVISVLILKLAWGNAKEAVGPLSDRAAPDETVDKIARLTGAIEDVREVHEIRTRSLGDGWSVDLHVLVDDQISVLAGHEIADRVKRRLLEAGPEVVDVMVHVEPVGTNAKLNKSG